MFFLEYVDKTIIDIEGRNAHAKKAISLLPKIDDMVERYINTRQKKEKQEQIFSK